MAEETTPETTTTTTDTTASTERTTPDGTAREEAFAHRLVKEREKWEKENAETFAKAKSHDELIESQKTEAQKAIDAAIKERDDALSLVEKVKREAALAKLPEDKREKYAESSIDVIEALATEFKATPAAAPSALERLGIKTPVTTTSADAAAQARARAVAALRGGK